MHFPVTVDMRHWRLHLIFIEFERNEVDISQDEEPSPGLIRGYKKKPCDVWSGDNIQGVSK